MHVRMPQTDLIGVSIDTVHNVQRKINVLGCISLALNSMQGLHRDFL